MLSRPAQLGTAHADIPEIRATSVLNAVRRNLFRQGSGSVPAVLNALETFVASAGQKSRITENGNAPAALKVQESSVRNAVLKDLSKLLESDDL